MSDGVLESPADPNDTQLVYYLTSTWAKIGQALGVEFEPYLPLVMPYVLEIANAKMDISAYSMYTLGFIMNLISSFYVQQMKRSKLTTTAVAGRL